ncbi:hypothetical protein XENOCAPTIV_007718 [Xenoophorus captivus]|uniref:Uncharacterized protein n=1 Tax=Xenoophorus captivus TaxID=1517983 RepID=A0ABV0R0B7_9TELE
MKSERYSRFTLQPSENGERHAEVNLSDYAAEDGAEAPGSPSFRPEPLLHSRRTAAFVILGTVIFRTAGSEGDLNLANRIFTTFKTLEMKPWTDIHYVQLPMPDRSILVLVTPTPLDSRPSTTLSSPQQSRLASLRSQPRPSPPTRLQLC